MPREAIHPELRRYCGALKRSPMLDTLPEHFVLARQRKMTHQDFMVLAFGDEVERRAQKSAADRTKKDQLDPQMRVENWDPIATHFATDRAAMKTLSGFYRRPESSEISSFQVEEWERISFLADLSDSSTAESLVPPSSS